MKEVYIVNIREVERGMYLEDDIMEDTVAFDSEEKAIKYLDEEFHKKADFYDITELGKYEYKDECAFHLQENNDSEAYGDWYIDADIKCLEVL